MRNFKKFLALVLAMLMVVSAAATVSAFEDVAEDNQFAEAIADLTVLDIVNGYDETNFGPEDAVTRQQFALMMARAITGITDDAEWAKGGLVAFDDVTEYQYAIATVVKAGIVDGFLDNTFRPEEGVTFIQALKMAVCALGYDDGSLEWWQGYYNVALDLGLTDNLNQILDKDQALNRGEVAQLIWNMIYAPAANGSTLAYDIFGIGVEEPVVEPAEITVMAIVATNKQYATENINVAEGGFVGVQEIVNGVPSGDVYYLPIADFGFVDDADAENYFLNAYAFENWNDGEYDAAYAYGTKDVIYNTVVTEAAKAATHLGKLTIDGKNYYMVEELTGTAIRNEVVVFNSNDTAYVYTDKVLALDDAGKVYDADGAHVLTARYNPKGEIIAYQEVATNKLLDEEQATTMYGIPVASNYDTHLGILGQDKLAGAYQLTTYDDDMDGVMDRAYYTPVYVDSHEPNLNSGKLRYGVMAALGKTNTTFVDVNGEAVTLADGQVFKYTYNNQLNQVTVLDTYDVQTGTINKIRTTTDTSSNKYKVTVTINGVDYILGNDYRDDNGLQSFSIYATNNKVDTIAKLQGQVSSFNSGYTAIGYTYENNFGPNAFKAKNLVRFVAVDDVIIVMETYDIEENYDLVVFEQATDYDSEAVYMDLWMDGVLVEDVAVTRVVGSNGKYVDLADLNIFKLSQALEQFFTAESGDIFKAVPTENGYQLSAAYDFDAECSSNTHKNAKKFVNTEDCDDAIKNVLYRVDDNDTTKTTDDTYYITRNAFGLAYVNMGYDGYETVTSIEFNDGVGEINSIHVDKRDYNAIRTDDETLFYFIKLDDGKPEDVTVFVGEPKDGSTLNDVTVYADNLGFTVGDDEDENTPFNNIKGVANTVVVYFDDYDDVKGFGISGVGTNLVYVTSYGVDNYGYIGDDVDLFDPYYTGDAEDLEMPKEYWGDRYHYYTGNLAIDMRTGARVTEIYAAEDEDIVPGNFYVLNDDNVVMYQVDDDVESLIQAGGNVALDIQVDDDVLQDDVNEKNRGWQIKGIGSNNGATPNQITDKVVMVKYNAELKAGNVKSGNDVIALLSADDEEPSTVVYVVTGNRADGDALVVGVVFPADYAYVEGDDATAYFYDGIGDHYYMGKASFTSATATQITGSVMFDDDSEDSDYDWDYELLFDTLYDFDDLDEDDLANPNDIVISVFGKKGTTYDATASYVSTTGTAGTDFEWYIEDDVLYFDITAEPVKNGDRPTATTNNLLGTDKTLDKVTIELTVNGEQYTFVMYN